MKIKKCLASNQRKRTLRRNKLRLANRRHLQFMTEQYSIELAPINKTSELGE
ncbi:MAG: hypothetical protein WBC60_16945 [Cognaticolwellia sp.]|jgi:hypothetical protein